jgi:hypothetical protein
MFPGHVASAYPLGRLRCALPSHQNPHAALRRRVDSRNQARRIPHYCVEKLFNESRRDRSSMPNGLRATTPRSPSPRWSTTPSSGRDGWNRSPAAAPAGQTLSGRGREIARAPRKSFRDGGAAMLPWPQMLARSPFAGTPRGACRRRVCRGLLPHCFQCARSWKQRSHQF